MIDALIVRPVLRVTTWIKRHPLLALLLLAILFFLPPFIVVAYAVLSAVQKAANAILGVKVGETVGKAVVKAGAWLAEKPSRCLWLAAGVSLFMPIAGAALAAWCFLDRFKSGEWTAKLDSRTPAPEPPPLEPPPPDYGLDDVFDQVFPV